MTICNGNARTFLTTVLERKEAPIYIACYINGSIIDTEYTTLFMPFIKNRIVVHCAPLGAFASKTE